MIQQARRAAAGLLCALLFLTGCGRVTAPASSSAVLAAMCAEPGGAGQDIAATCAVYTRAASPYGDEYLSDTLFSALYGEAARGLLQGTDEIPAAINDAAVCLSVAPVPLELAVFRCSDTRGTATAVGLCRARLETVRGAWRGTDHEAVVTEGVVTVEGSYVLLVVAPNPDRVLRAARAAIRRGDTDAP